MRLLNLLLGAAAMTALAAPALAQPTISRGEQYMPITFPECMARARTAFERLGWVNIGPQANLTSAFKGTEAAYIVCNETTGGRYVINIFVASASGDAGIAGAQRQSLQGGMEGRFIAPAPPPPMGGPVMAPTGHTTWTLNCCAGAWRGDIVIDFGQPRGSVVPFTGAFSAALNYGNIVGGTWDQATGALYFRRDFGTGTFQDYTGQVIIQNGRPRVVNGRWTGAYADQGAPDWGMELK